MWRKLFSNPTISISRTPTTAKLFFSSSSSSSSSPIPGVEEPVPALYSFLRPTLFSPLTTTTPPPPPPSSPPHHHHHQTRAPEAAAALHSALLASIRASDTDGAWRSFKALTAASHFPPPDLSHALISHLSSLPDLHNLKRAFASAVLLLEKRPRALPFVTLQTLFSALDAADALGPALALARAMLKNRVFAPFTVWGGAVIRITRRSRSGGGGLCSFLEVFEENCRIAAEEGVQSMVPDLDAFNVAMGVCCRELGSVSGSKRIVETMSTLGVVPDIETFGAMAYLFAWKGLESRIVELQELVLSLGLADDTEENKTVIHENLIGGYVKSSNLESISAVILRALREGGVKDWKGFGGETYAKVVKCFLENGSVKEVAGLIVDSQELESTLLMTGGVECSVGFGVVNAACVSLGMLDKAHSVLDEMHARGASVGIGVYSPILKAYCKERRTAEAAQLVMQIRDAGLQLDSGSYDSLIDASMSVQDFQSAFSLFRGMREASLPDLKMSYLTIMTGLMENHRPELMAGFLDSVVDDPRVEVATHDWNSIIHAFCKVGRLEDARRTYRRLLFLQFEPNEQTYLSLINGYVSAEKYFSVLILWTDIKKKKKTAKFDNALVDAFLYALVKGGFFDASMEVVEKARELKIFIDKWRYKQAFMETHKKLKVAKMRRKSMKKTEALVAFKNWAGLNA